jgi:putative ABC transport system permease protein
MTTLAQEIRFALRMLRKHPSYTLIAVVTIALGIGANSAIFNVVNAALIRPLRYGNADRLVFLGETGATRPYPGQLSYTDYQELKQQTTTLEQTAAYGFDGGLLTGYGEAEMLNGSRVTASFFPVLGVKPRLGRNFTPEEESGAGAPAVILTDALWRQRFQADPQIIGRGLRLSDKEWTVVGVLPADFSFAKMPTSKIYFPLRAQQVEKERRYFHWMSAIGLVKKGVPLEKAQADLNTIAARFGVADPQWHKGIGLGVIKLQRDIVGDYQPILLMLMLAVALVLLIACANIANLMLARTSARQKEIATRVALGASRWRIARLLLVESTVLASIGAAVGVVWAFWCNAALIGAIPMAVRESAPFLNNSSFDLPVILFAAALAMFAGVLFGALPALRFSRTDVNTILKASAGTTSGARSFVYDFLIVGEVAMALMLVVGAGLLTLSLDRLLKADPGFDSNGIVTASFTVPPAYKDGAQIDAFQREVLDKVRELPGVEGAATTDSLPLMGQGGTGSPQVVGRAVTPGREYQVDLRDVSADYFSVMKIPFVGGRAFELRDVQQDRPVVIINRQLAADLFPEQNPIGQHVKFAFTGDTQFEIVGVVGNESVRTLDTPNLPALYFHAGGDRGVNLVIRTNATTGIEPAVRAAIAALNPDVPVQKFATMQQLIAESPMTFIHRYPAILLSGFGVLALILALVGIYGVVAYSVTQRTREIGIRIALGASTSSVLDTVMRRNVVLTLAGLALGILGTFVIGGFVRGLLYGIQPSNPVVIASAVLLLATVSLLASYIPARQATRVDPLISLREQ